MKQLNFGLKQASSYSVTLRARFLSPMCCVALDYLGTVCLSCDAVFLNDSREAGSAAGNTDKGVFGAHCGHHGKGSVAQITPLVAQTCPDGWYGFMSSVSLERDP